MNSVRKLIGSCKNIRQIIQSIPESAQIPQILLLFINLPGKIHVFFQKEQCFPVFFQSADQKPAVREALSAQNQLTPDTGCLPSLKKLLLDLSGLLIVSASF